MPTIPKAAIDFKQRIEMISREALKRRDPQYFEVQARLYIMESQLPKRMLKDAKDIRSVVQKEEEQKWIEEHSIVIPNLADDLTKSSELYADKVFESLRRGIVRNESDDELLTRIRRTGDVLERHQKTILATARAAIAREATVAAVALARLPNTQSDPFMIYLGGETSQRSRDFCIRTKGQVKRMSEWGNMINDFGQSVLLYCGGWNCAHRLVVMLDYDPKTFNPDIYNAARK